MGSLNEYCNLLLGFNCEDLNPKSTSHLRNVVAWLQLGKLSCTVCIREDIRLDFWLEGGFECGQYIVSHLRLPQTRSVNWVCVCNVSLCTRWQERWATAASPSLPSAGTHQTTGSYSLSLENRNKCPVGHRYYLRHVMSYTLVFHLI